MLCLSYHAYVFSSTKLEKRAEQVLPGREWGEGKREGVEGEKWPKQCMHI
jgi:ribosomal protein L19E